MDHPNVVTGQEVVPGAVGRSSIERRKRDWAHAPGVIEARIHGLSPDQAHGAVFRVPEDCLVPFDEDMIRHAVTKLRWPALVGIDYGTNTFCAVIGLLDDRGRITVVDEYMSFRESMDVRMGRLIELLEGLGDPRPVFAWGDSAGPFVIESRAALKRLGRTDIRLDGTRKRKVKGARNTQAGYVEGGIDRVNNLFDRGVLRVRKGLESSWRKGAQASSPGRPVEGESRLLWELANLQWDERNPDKPNKDSADGAHATDALRYLVVGWWDELRARTPEEKQERERRRRRARAVPRAMRGLPQDEFDERGNRIRDRGLERRIQLEERQRGRRGF